MPPQGPARGGSQEMEIPFWLEVMACILRGAQFGSTPADAAVGCPVQLQLTHAVRSIVRPLSNLLNLSCLGWDWAGPVVESDGRVVSCSTCHALLLLAVTRIRIYVRQHQSTQWGNTKAHGALLHTRTAVLPTTHSHHAFTPRIHTAHSHRGSQRAFTLCMHTEQSHPACAPVDVAGSCPDIPRRRGIALAIDLLLAARHSTTQPLCHSATQPPCNSATLPLSQTITLTPRRSIRHSETALHTQRLHPTRLPRIKFLNPPRGRRAGLGTVIG